MLATLRRSTLATALASVALAAPAFASQPLVRITEAMSSSAIPTPDWFELTNFGTEPVDITGWKVDDSSFTAGVAVALSPYTTGGLWSQGNFINPGESVVFVESAGGAALPSFMTLWNLGSGTANVRNPKLGFYSGSGIGLSSGGDGLVLFDAANQEVTPRLSFGAATSGRSFYWSYDSSGQLATSSVGTLSQNGSASAYASQGGADVASPGAATVAAGAASTRYWSANGTTLGGSGTWSSAAANWSAAVSPVTAGPWLDGASAVFRGTAGSVSVAAPVRPASLAFETDGFTLAAGSGSITTEAVVVGTGLTATIGARLTGSSGLGIAGGGTLVLTGTTNDYSGATTVIQGTGRSGASHAIPDASRLSVARFATYDFAEFTDTVAGLSGLGTIRSNGTIVVNVADSADQRFDGFLSGTGGLVIDSDGTGRQIFNTTGQTLGDQAVKDYGGSTVIRRGTLAVNHTAVPRATSGVTIESGGRLELTSDTQTYQFGGSAATVVNLAGGSIGQEAGEDVTLTNAIDVTADSTIAVATSATPDPLDPTIEFISLTGPLSGAAGRTLSLVASNTTPGEDRARVDFTRASGNTFAGTIAAGVNMSARFAGDYSAARVTMGGGTLEGAGVVGAVTGSGLIAPGLPDEGIAPGIGILAVETVSPAGFDFQFEFQMQNADPFWSTADFSGNDVLRLSGATPFGDGALGSSNAVSLLLDVFELFETDTFRGGFFTTTDQSAAIGSATYSVFVRNDTPGITPDLTVAGVTYSSLANWNLANATTLGPAISMVSVEAMFDGFTPTTGYVMELSFGGEEPPDPPPPLPPYAGGYVVNPQVADDTDVPWGTTNAWQATGSTVGLSFGPPKAGDSIAVDKLEEGRRNVDLGGERAVGNVSSTVDGNENVATNGGVRFRAGTLRFDTATSGSTASLITYSGTGNGRLEFRFDGVGESIELANDLRVVADNTAGRVDFRGTLSGSHTITKAGAGEMRFSATFDDLNANLFDAGGFTGVLVVEEGVVRLSHQTPLSATAGITVADGGQLRLDGVGSSGDFTYDLGTGPLTISGFGRDPALGFGSSSGAIRQHEGVEGQTATIANDVVLAADAGVHVEAVDTQTGVGGTLLNLTGDLSGPGRVVKTGGARLILSGSNSSGGLDVRSGTVTIASAHALAVAPLRFESETSVRALELFGDHVVTSLDGDSPDPLESVEGVPNTNTLTLRLGGAGTALTVNQAFASGTDEFGELVEQSTRFQGDIAGAGGFVKDGDGLLAFTRYAKTYTGSTTIREGVLEVSAAGIMNATAGVAVESGGQLRLSSSGTVGAPAAYTFGGSADRTVALAGFGRTGLPADSGLATTGALRYEPGGGPGQAVLANAVVLAADAGIHVSGTDKSLTLSGPVTGAGGFTKTGAGTLVLSGSTGYVGATRIETGRLALGAAATPAASPLIEVGAGTTFDVTAKAGGYAVASGQTLAGAGTVEGSIAIGTAATLAPGASPGTLTVTQNVSWGTGGSYNWQVADFAASAGSATGWDLLSVGGVLDVAATTASPFAINVWSLAGTGPDVNGPAANFNAAQNGSWKIASAAGGITNFSADKFTVVTAAANGTGGFANDLAGGTFSVTQSANDILLAFTAATLQADPVKVKGVYATGTGWNATYAALSPFSTVGGTAAGWRLRDGALQTSGSSALTWSNLNRFTIEFDQAIATPLPGALQVILGTGTGNRVFTPTAVSLLAGGSAAQWTMPAVLANGSYVLSLASAGIESAEGGVALDGEWQTNVSTFAAGSGDGEAGGIFNFAFDVLIGDVNATGNVNNSDTIAARGQLFRAVTGTNFRSDLNGSNSINNTDITALRGGLFRATTAFVDPEFPTEGVGPRSLARGSFGGEPDLDLASLSFAGPVAVPEPATSSAAAVAAAALALRWLRRRRWAARHSCPATGPTPAA